MTHVGDMTVADRPRIAALLSGLDQFNETEVEVALELFDAAFSLNGVAHEPDYRFVGAYGAADDLLGYACYGPTPQTDRAWDLYWIAVAKETQGRGVGGLLLAEVESRLAAAAARFLLIETSTRTDYDRTRSFYADRGYCEEARIPDFYAPGDDRLLLTKSLLPGVISPKAGTSNL